jgi:hypothetical protein
MNTLVTQVKKQKNTENRNAKNTIISNAKTHCEKMQFQHNSNANAKHVKDKRHENASAEKKI